MAELNILSSGLLEREGVVHGFTTRRGGVSEPPFDTLNLSPARGDAPRAVVENRTRVRNALGLEALAFCRQVHGNRVLRVDRISSPLSDVGEADALITDRPGIGLAAQTADCTPILILDPDRPATAAVHAGWRGVANDVVGETVAALAREYGSAPQRLLAAIGPSISRTRYRVGPEVLEAFEARLGSLDTDLVGPIDPEGGATLDVAEGVRRQLESEGLRPGRIERIAACTFSDSRFFSSRRSRDGAFGGQAGVIGLRTASRSPRGGAAP